ncbi:MAG: TrbC/VirB2 family protein [Methylophilaceae bacterium]|nr:TrbC/VirB2 family protein [Methylophilaceae bacterium]
MNRNIKLFSVLAILLLVCPMPSFAALNVGMGLLNDIVNWLRWIGVAIITIALMFVGFRMAFQAAQWKDVAPVFWGALIVGTAGVLAPALLAGN